MDEVRLARSALRGFGIDARRIGLAYNSTNLKYRVTTPTGAAFGLRVGRPEWPLRDWARSMAEWQAHLCEAGLQVPVPIRARDGDWAFVVEESGSAERVCTMSTWLPGRRLLKNLTSGQAAPLGNLLARVHEVSRAFVPPDGFELRRPFEPAGSSVDGARALVDAVVDDEQRGLIDRWRARVAEYLAEARQRSEYGVVVGDFGPQNVVWAQSTPQLIDLGDTAWGAYGYDVAYLYQVLAPDLRESALDGYAAVHRLPYAWEMMRGAFLLKVMHARVSRPDGQRIVQGFVRELAALGQGP